jgi:CBS domain-containing protein
MSEAHAGQKHERAEQVAQEDNPHTKKVKTDKETKEQKKHTVFTESAPWVSSNVVSPSQYIADFLKATPALSIIPDRGADKVLSVNADHHAAQAQSLMAKENILSCPVYDKELQAFVGFVDYLDLTSLVVGIVQHIMEEDFSSVESIALLDNDERHKLVIRAKEAYNQKKLFDIAGLSKLDPFKPIPKGATLYQAVQVLAEMGVHRVPIQNDEQKLEAILSQSAVVDFLFNNLDKFSTKTKLPIKSFVTPRTVHTVHEKAVAFEAFESMIKNKVTAVGVADDEGKLTGVISSTDLRMIGPHAHSIATLFHSAREFVEKAQDINKWTLLPVVTVALDETLGIAIEKMQDNFVHRVFVVEDDKPVGVISMKDVLLQFLKE